MHATEHCSTSSTTTAIPADLSNQDYECHECFVTFEEDIMLENEAEWASVVVEGGFMLILFMKLLLVKMESQGCARIVLCDSCFK